MKKILLTLGLLAALTVPASATNTVATSTVRINTIGCPGWDITFAATASAAADTSYAIVPIVGMLKASQVSGVPTFTLTSCVENSNGVILAAADSARSEFFFGSAPSSSGSGENTTSGPYHKLTTFATDGTSNYIDGTDCRSTTFTTMPLNYLRVYIVNKHASAAATFKMRIRFPQSF